MENSKQPQNLKLLPIAVLLIITPLLSTSARFKYLYFIVNILIIAVGAEAGLLSFFLRSEDNNKPAMILEASSAKEEKGFPEKENSDNGVEKQVKNVDECSSENRSDGVEVVRMEKSRPLNPSIFFVGGDDPEELMEDDAGGENGDLSGMELYEKSEIFIGNFYKQLKMQREESWKKLHGHLS